MSRLPWLLGGGAALAYLWSRSRHSKAGAPPSGVVIDAPPASATPLPGRWVWPVPVWNGRQPDISSGWGSVRDEGTRLHKGADIMFHRAPNDPYPANTPNGSKGFVMPDNLVAVAASDGVVWSAGPTARGLAVVIDHGKPSNVATFYQHLSSLLVSTTSRGRSGQRVVAGQPIGIVGGDPLDSRKLKHLHFEIWRGGPSAAVDPAPLLRSWALIADPRSGSAPRVARNHPF